MDLFEKEKMFICRPDFVAAVKISKRTVRNFFAGNLPGIVIIE